MKMAGIDKNLTRQEERSRQRKEAEYERRKREQTRKAGEASVSTWQESGSETNEWFGPCDNLRCHCATGCNLEGFCYNNGKCINGWFGIKCQYQNIANNGTLNPLQYSMILYDGDNSTCIDDLSLQSLEVKWDKSYPFTWMRLVVKDQSSQNVVISYKEKTISNEVICLNQKLLWIDTNTVDIQCKLQNTIQQFKISGDIVRSICELAISGGRNVALKGTAEQQSTFSTCDASLAVDGNTSTVYSKCAHTAADNDLYPYWKVQLQNSIAVNRYVIFNRDDDCSWCPKRLDYFNLNALNSQNQIVFNYYDQYGKTEKVYMINDVNNGIILQVNISQRHIVDGQSWPVITLCEVEIYGDCPGGFWGMECTNQCDKKCSDSCIADGGWCPIQSCWGFTNPPFCNNPCPKTYWGNNCSTPCNITCLNSLCDAQTGKCTDGCVDGYQIPDCTQACEQGHYGKNCSFNCSSTCTDNKCNAVNGTCFSCLPGLEGTFCEKPCKKGNFGINCSQVCSSNCSDGECKPMYGECYSCLPGYLGFYCNTTCPKGAFGLNCSANCPANCFNRSCDPANGKCVSCTTGYHLDYCNTTCNATSFGPNCVYPCRNICLDQKCDSKTGDCLQCSAGKFGGLCEDCPLGRFGEKCQQNCSAQCKNGTTCDKVDGLCPFGCELGYEGTSCFVKSAEQTPDDVGVIVGSVIGGVVFLALVVLGIIWCRRTKFRSRKKDVLTVRDHSFNNEAIDTCITHKDVSHPSLIKKTKESGGYYNTIPLVTKDKRINVNDLHTFMNSHKSDQLLAEFKTLPDTPNVTTEAGLKDDNRNKNRFKNICPYDHSRVHLEINTGKNEMDYINASYIEGFNNEVKFIASQGPSTITLTDFVRMLWEQNTEKVVMLTNLIEEGKTKCEKYWPDSDKKVVGEIKIKHLATQTFAHYTVRQLELTKKNHVTHHVTQFHFTSWPDKSVPAASWSLVDFQQHVFATPTLKPIVVHCSAGVGRTGTFIALYNVKREAEELGHINFYETVIKLRHDRMLMVQTAEQYEFLHKAALAAIVCSGTAVSVDNFKEKPNSLHEKTLTGKSKITLEYKAICNVCEVYQKRLVDNETSAGDNIYQNAETAVSKLKNRFPEIFPNDLYRPRLTGYSVEDGDYINAVVLPSLRQSDQQIITQLPLPTTVTDFWRLVTQYNITLALAFEVDSMLDDQTFGQYIPSSSDPVLTCSPFEIKSVYVKDKPLWQEQRLNVCCEKKTSLPSVTPMVKENHEIVHMECKSIDVKLSQFLSFIKEARKHATSKGRILFMCKNGALYSGLACVLFSLLDKMDSDSSINIPLVVGCVKSVRPEVIPSSEQYELLYQMLHQYSESSEYSNVQSRLESSKNAIPRISQKIDEVDINNIYANYK
ncbi:hypothetical protein Btru_033551 [Bulinus truncatus]|nr:hypothetical protein Btru_033551 [Bulinus truncatus]